MPRILLAVDGSDNSLRATQKMIDSFAWYKDTPIVELLTVHLPVPHLPNMHIVVSQEMIDQYYAEETAASLAPARNLLDGAGVRYEACTRVGQIAESIVERAREAGSDLIYMGTRGRTALGSMVLGSVALRVLHIAPVPLVLIR